MNKISLFCFFFLVSTWMYAQEKFSLELYGGPSQAFLPFAVYPTNFKISPSNPISWHVGLNYITNLSPSWQLSAQVEFFKRQLGTFAYSAPIDSIRITGYSTDGIPLIALGVRKNWSKLRHSLFLQPSMSMMKSPAFLDIYEDKSRTFLGYPLGLMSISNLGLGIRVEGGIKKFLAGGNYLTFGLRYQQGLVLMDQMNAPVFYGDRLEHVLVAKSRGTYLGAFLGLGVVGQNLKKTKSRSLSIIMDDKNLENAKLADENGMFAFLSGGLRLRENLLDNSYIYSNLSGQFQVGIGYYFEDFSIETGFGNFSYNNNHQFDYDGYQAVFMSFEHFSASAIPFTFKYHLSLDNLKNWKIGPSFSGFFILANSGSLPNYYGNGVAQTEIEGQIYEAKTSFRALPSRKNGLVYNSGLFVERRFLNSSFLSLKISRNFGSPVLSRIESRYQINGEEIIQIHDGGLNGFLLDISYRLPLNLTKGH